ncbi:MAG: hypothetical protein ABSA46_09555 [Thermodesulfovibrionales bacterium]
MVLHAFRWVRGGILRCLIIIGSKELSSEHLIEGEKISYLGYVEKEGVGRFYSYADLFVHPLLPRGSDRRDRPGSHGVRGTRYLSHGGSLPEVSGDAGMLFDP